MCKISYRCLFITDSYERVDGSDTRWSVGRSGLTAEVVSAPTSCIPAGTHSAVVWQENGRTYGRAVDKTVNADVGHSLHRRTFRRNGCVRACVCRRYFCNCWFNYNGVSCTGPLGLAAGISLATKSCTRWMIRRTRQRWSDLSESGIASGALAWWWPWAVRSSVDMPGIEGQLGMASMICVERMSVFDFDRGLPLQWPPFHLPPADLIWSRFQLELIEVSAPCAMRPGREMPRLADLAVLLPSHITSRCAGVVVTVRQVIQGRVRLENEQSTENLYAVFVRSLP